MTRRVTCRSLSIVALVLCSLLAMGPEAEAQKSKVVREGVEQILQAFGRQAGPTYTRELAELGGEAAVRELAERLVKTGGQNALAQAVRLTRSHGPDTLRALGNSSLCAMSPAMRYYGSWRGCNYA